jgi:ribosomal protein S4E
MVQQPLFDYGDTVQVTGGAHIGEIGSVCAISGSESSRTYTVEFGDGSDSEIEEALLVKFQV